jgi:hypothetical protein
MSKTSIAKFRIGQVIRHELYAFRGVVFDVDAEAIESRKRLGFKSGAFPPFAATDGAPVFPASRS